MLGMTVLGAGSWGTALALHLAQKMPVTLWSHNANQAAQMEAERANNRYLPGYTFPATLTVTHDLELALSASQDILIAVPSSGFRETLEKIKPHLRTTQRIIWASKGLDLNTGHLLHEVVLQVLGANYPYAILSGPSFAKEVAQGLPTAIVIACNHSDFAKDAYEYFNTSHFRVYLSNDLVGVEVGGVVKNVLAIAAGIADGLQLGANARSALITRGLAEMMRLGIALGAKAETLTGLTGLGDLILTCTDDLSRNRRFGLKLGQGKTLAEASQEIGQVIEGKRNADLVVQLAKQHQVAMPIAEMVWEVLQGNITLTQAIQNLLTRSNREEY